MPTHCGDREAEAIGEATDPLTGARRPPVAAVSSAVVRRAAWRAGTKGRTPRPRRARSRPRAARAGVERRRLRCVQERRVPGVVKTGVSSHPASNADDDADGREPELLDDEHARDLAGVRPGPL